VIQLSCTLALLVLIFELADQGPVRYFFVMFLPFVWIATRQGLLGAGIALFAVMVGLITLIQVQASSGGTLFELQARVLGLGITALVLGIVVDERRRVQQRLQQSMRLAAAGEMAAALAHELNQPQTALVGYGKACQLLLAREDMDKLELSRTVDKSAAQAQRIAAIVARLRDFLRSGRMNLERVDVGELITRVRHSVAPMYDADAVQLSVQIAPQLGAVHVDRVEAEIVLRNLLTNAAESIRDANATVRSVRIEAQAAEPGFIRVSVLDSGPGIAPEIEERLFSPFATSKSHGMGMGLAVSRAIVEAHGGRLWAEPAPQGIFHMTLPTISGDFDGDSR
jgi:C4-dicarboxylate-specific signal transduction histidine kinase